MYFPSNNEKLPYNFLINDNEKNEKKFKDQQNELSEINPKYSFRLRNLIIKMLSRDKLQRPTINDLITALEYLSLPYNPNPELKNSSLAIFDKDNNTPEEKNIELSFFNNNESITNTLIKKSTNLNIKGIELYQKGNLYESLSVFEELLMLRTIFYGEISPEVAEVYNNLTLLYLSIDEKLKSEMCHKKSEKIWKILNNIKENPILRKRNNEIGKNVYPSTTSKELNSNNSKNENEKQWPQLNEDDKSNSCDPLKLGNLNQNAESNNSKEDKNIDFMFGEKNIKSSKYSQLRLIEQDNKESELIEAQNYENKGDFYSNIDFENSCIYYKKALQLKSQFFGYYHKEVAKIFIKIGRLYLNSGDTILGNSYIKKGIQSFHES